MSNAQVIVNASRDSRLWHIGLVVALSLPLFAWVISLPPVAQPLSYHNFADQHWLYGVPNFWNVASNLPFAVIGGLGCWWLIRTGSRTAFTESGERVAYFVFFVGEFLTCFGSAYYHAWPGNDTLVWDRLAFSTMLTSTFAIVVTEFVNRRAGRLILWPMVALGVFSVLSWAWSESMGQGDMRLYLLVQFYPMLALPVILLLFRSQYTCGGVFWVMWALYAVAKIAELYDGPILDWSSFWSGHTVKHLVAAGASYLPLYSLRHRTRRSASTTPAPAKSFAHARL